MNRATVCRDANRLPGCGITEDSFSSNFERQMSTQNRLELSRLPERHTNLWLINVRGNRVFETEFGWVSSLISKNELAVYFAET